MAFIPPSPHQPSPTSFSSSCATTVRRRGTTTSTMMVAMTTDYPPEVSHSSQSISTATGDADRAFRDGMALEKLGLARSASASFHEAATLYQCFLDGENNVPSFDDGGAAAATNVFRRVTSLPSSASAGGVGGGGPTVQSALAYCCLRLAHLSHDAFGDPRASVRLYDLSSNIDPYPGGAAYHGVGICVEASATMTNGGGASSSSSSSHDDGTTEKMVWRNEMERAVNAYREARALGGGLGSNGEVSFHLAVALEVRSMNNDEVQPRRRPTLVPPGGREDVVCFCAHIRPSCFHCCMLIMYLRHHPPPLTPSSLPFYIQKASGGSRGIRENHGNLASG